jgi:hypothetical protein
MRDRQGIDKTAMSFATALIVLVYALLLPLGSSPLAAEGYDIVIIAGQSNATDRGDGAFTPSFPGQDARIRQIGRFGDDDMQVVAVGRLHDGIVWGGLQHWTDKPKRYFMGFALPFARIYARRQLAPNRTVLIVPAAKGGTSIRSWLGESGQPSLDIYPDMLARVQRAKSQPGRNRIVAFLWHQGEADLMAGMAPKTYREKRIEFFSRVRSDIPGAYPILTAKFTAAWLAGDPLKRAFERAIGAATEQDGLGRVVSRAGLLSNGEVLGNDDIIHFSAQANQTLGSRLFSAWASINSE